MLGCRDSHVRSAVSRGYVIGGRQQLIKADSVTCRVEGCIHVERVSAAHLLSDLSKEQVIPASGEYISDGSGTICDLYLCCTARINADIAAHTQVEPSACRETRGHGKRSYTSPGVYGNGGN